MILPVKPLNEINTEAFKLLYRELGPTDATRFIQQFSGGFGDYTADRQQVQERDAGDLDDLVAEIRNHHPSR